MKRQPRKRRKNGAGTEVKIHHEGRYSQPRTSLTKGVSRRLLVDGHGRLAAYWCATIQCEGVNKMAKFSVTKYTECGARMRAALRRMEWLIDFKVWRPEMGDPFSGLAQFNEDMHAASTEDRYGNAWSASSEEAAA